VDEGLQQVWRQEAGSGFEWVAPSHRSATGALRLPKRRPGRQRYVRKRKYAERCIRQGGFFAFQRPMAPGRRGSTTVYSNVAGCGFPTAFHARRNLALERSGVLGARRSQRTIQP
jgi:hypothetical protein